ncbi:Prosaposin receptor GPR37L1 [Larimichthys crocea]|uniref:Uncharacterized protein n=1 Tax=Larimichthys crocea TaxID=215358 RepID=A0ACD3RBR4_LARCR|nr:Prosaposin receptor GPR37L1 [Larimichthys crocea]
MAPSVGLWLCLYLSLLFTDAKSVEQHDNRRNALDKPSSRIKLEPLWITKQLRAEDDTSNPQSLSLSELLDLDLDQHRRLARGTDEEEQQSTFSQSFENDSDPRPFNPFYPLAESSYAAYAILFLGGLVLVLGVVGNMAVMCVVWNNYYMRSAWNYLLASMAFWDFLVLVLCLPVVVLNQLSHRRILGDITCRMVPYMEAVSLGITSFTLCALGIDRFHAATSSSQPKARRVERCRSVLLKLLLVWLTALLLSSPEIFLWQLSQSLSPSTSQLVDSCVITPSSPLSLYLPDSLHSLLLRYHQGRMWWCFGCYFCLPILFTILCQMATRNVSSDSNSTQKQRNQDDRSSNQKRQQHQAVERQLNCTLLALAVVYGVCALPEHVCKITLAYTHITGLREHGQHADTVASLPVVLQVIGDAGAAAVSV